MGTIKRFFQMCLIKFIRAYRFTISLMLGHCCRFEPTCSTYMMNAIEHHGSLKGVYLGLRRLLCCHPWHPGGYDPTPIAKNQKQRMDNCFVHKTSDPIYQPRS